jgi:uncharacterized protein (TIGR04255 family)
MGIPLINPPVYYTVTQVRFNPILKLKEFLADIQDGLRKLGYPDYRVQSGFVWEIGSRGSQEQTVRQIPNENYIFGDAPRKHSFVLTNNSLAFQSTQYGNFVHFAESFLRGLAVVHEFVRLDYIERVGLRYLDRVSPGENEQLEQYLIPEVLGVAGKVTGVQNSLLYSETHMQKDDVKLISRTTIQEGPITYPADLGQIDLNIDQRFHQHAGRHAILDNDGSIDRREVFATATVRTHLTDAHELIALAFAATTTEFAMNAWNRP